MREERFVINDRSWSIIEPLVPGTEAGSRCDGEGYPFVSGGCFMARARGRSISRTMKRHTSGGISSRTTLVNQGVQGHQHQI